VLSHRLNWHPPENALSRLLAVKRQSGEAILDLTESNPTRAALPYPPGVLDPLSCDYALVYDPNPRGSMQARSAIAYYYRRFEVDIPENRILLTASTSEAYSYLFKLLADPGDEILAPRPSYPLFEFLAALSSVTMRQYPLRYDGVWHIDFAALEQATTSRTRAIVCVNPNNPTGSFLKSCELAHLEEIAIRHDLALISDEVFGDYVLDSAPDRVNTLAGDRRALSFSMSGLSKVTGLPQLKLGWIAASGPGHEEAVSALELIVDTYLSVSTPVQVALPSLLASAAPVQQAVTNRTKANLKLLRDTLHASRATVLNVEGGWYATVRVPNTSTEEEWTLRLLREQNVIVQPGYFFDFETEAFLVISLLTPSDIFAEGLRRLRIFL
jgi:aspartate/methionine/tyrosine aminotransferase